MPFQKGNKFWVLRKWTNHSEESRKKISLAKSGKPSSRKGIKLSLEQKVKLSISHIGQKPWNKGKKGISTGWKKGKKFTFEHRRRIKNILNSKSDIKRMILSLQEYATWREQIFKRDNYICQECGIHNGLGKSIQQNAHHIKSFWRLLNEFLQAYSQFSPIEDKEILVRLAINYKPFWDINNGITLCEDCHKKTKSYGYRH